MALDIRVLAGDELRAAIPSVAALRIEVFRDFPYLYDGDLLYEERYLAPYTETPQAVLIGAYEGDQLVGASTGMPLNAHADDFSAAFANCDIPQSEVFYCAESVLLPAYRGQGVGHVFFDLREAEAKAQGLTFSAFCSVLRARDHPLRPASYQPLDRFWRARGYAPLPGVIAVFDWKDIGETRETPKQLQFWGRRL
ncbi:MAG: GNAT family N-acetyltransferase [Pseudomonadota bacterium]